jgi:hypothetical protein
MEIKQIARCMPFKKNKIKIARCIYTHITQEAITNKWFIRPYILLSGDNF